MAASSIASRFFKTLTPLFFLAALVPVTAFGQSAPSITQQPQSQTVVAGTNVSFTVAATGQTPFTYQWSFNGLSLTNDVQISGATNATLSLANVAAYNAGNYQVVVYDRHANPATSAVAVLTVVFPPAITNQPVSQIQIAGSNALFSAAVTGSQPMGFHWFYNGQALADSGRITGATDLALSITSLTTNDNGNYTFVATNAFGSITSVVATLTVVIPPAISLQPADQTGTFGLSASFTGAATSTAPIIYQWLHDGVPLANDSRISGATSGTLNLTSLTNTDAGGYQLVASNYLGVVTSVVVTLTVVYPPAISVQPSNQTGAVGFSVSFTGAATGTAPISYQWLHDGALLTNDSRISGAKSNTLVLTSLTNSDAGGYQLVASNYLGVATSLMASLTVVPPSCTPPASGLVGWWPGESNANDITGSNNAALFGGATYASGKVGSGFRLDGTNAYVAIPDSAALKPANVTAEAWVWLDPGVTNFGGEYIIFKRNTWTFLYEGYALAKYSVLNGDGTYSNYFQFLVTRSGNQVVLNSTTAIQRGVWYHVAGTYDGNKSTLWVNGVAEASATPGFALDYDTLPVYIGTSGEPPPYRGMFAGIIDEPSIYNRALSTNEIFAIYQAGSLGKCQPPMPPLITLQPTNQVVTTNVNLSLVASVTGVPTPVLRWYFNGTALADDSRHTGSSTATLNLLNTQTNDTGSYWLVASNWTGAATSSVVSVSVLLPPAISQQPNGQTVLVGSNAAFTVSATGGNPLAYQWYFQGVALTNNGRITGATTASLAITNAQFADVGNYTVTVTNPVGSATSAIAALNVVSPPVISVQPSNQTGAVGFSASFTGAATGTAPISYQWLHDGALLANDSRISGANSSTLVLTGLTNSDAGGYQLVASNYLGIASSAVATLTVFTPPPCVSPAAGLVSWWPAEGNANDITGTNNGTLSSSGASYASGEVGQGFRFDGTNGYVQIADSPDLKPTNVTVEAWVWLDPNVTNNGGEQIVFKKNTSTAWFEGYSLAKDRVDNGNGTFTDRFAFIVSRNGNQVILHSTTVAQRGVWYHVAGTYDGNKSTLWVNGLSEAAATPGFALDYGSDPVYIGTSGTWPPYLSMFAGIIDEASIYNRALSSNEIAAIYQAGSAGKCSGPPPPTPPFISSQPASQTVLTNATATFTVSAGGTQPLGYQWYFNNALLTDNGHVSGSAATNLFVFNSQAADVGNYFVIVTNAFGSVTSSVASLLVLSNQPSIVSQPQNQVVPAGSNAVFSATADGDAPLSYQWYFNGAALTDSAHIIGSASNNLTVVNAQSGDVGNYSLTVTNPVGMATSSVVSLTVLFPPVVTTQPVGRSVPPGLPTTFTGAASGSPAPGYQWQLNGVDIPGATNTTYSIAAVGTNDLGFYHLIASNSVTVAVSADAQLTFGPVAAWGRNLSNESLPPPGMSNVFAVVGSPSASFALRANGTIAAWGSGSITNIPASATNVVAVAATSTFAGYALRSDGTAVSWNGISAPPLSNIVAIAAGDNFGYALRAEGTLTNWGSIPTPGFTGLNHIAAIACGYNNAVALRNDGTVVISGSGAVTNVPGSVTNVIAVAVGYTYAMALRTDGRVIAWGNGSITNLPASLTNVVAISAGKFSGENFGLAVRSNGKVVAFGDNTFGETNPPAALSNLISVAVAAAPFHGLALVNDGSPVIIHPPIGLTAFLGRDVTLRGDAVGAQPLSYQWLLNGTNIPGATNTSLVISNIQFANAGNYQLFVSNTISTAVSLPAPLTVISNSALTFLSLPAAQTNYQGGKVLLSEAVLGNGPLRYQWYFSRTNIGYVPVSGGTNDSLSLEPALAVQSGNYYVAVSNLVGGITSLNPPGVQGPTPANVKIQFGRGWGYLGYSNPPVNVTNAIAIATGGAIGGLNGHYFVLGSDGKLASWASYPVSYGETNVSALSNSFVTAIAAGNQHSLALKSDGTVYAWGYGFYGQTNPPSGLNNVVAIACGDSFDLALKSDGTVVGWGQNTSGQATNNPAATNVVAIAAGYQHSLALRVDGTVVGWGYNGYGQTTIPVAAANVVAVAAGQYHSLALRANGTVVGWGNNGNGQVTIPATLSNIVAISASGSHSTMLRSDGTVISLGYEYIGFASNNVPADLANVVAIASGSDHDFGLLGNRAPNFTVQPWNRAIPLTATTNIILAAKCAGVQPVFYQWQLNGTNVPGATNDMLILTNQPLPIAQIRLIPTGVYQLIASNAYGIVASKYAKITAFYPLGEALDTLTDSQATSPLSLYNWITTGNAQWFGQTNTTHDGVDAARSGGIGGLQESILQTTVATNWSGRYTFWWKVSSEQYFDALEFRINGSVQTSISGEVDWQQVSIPVGAGTNILQWRYSKDSSYDAGQDAGWVDQFVFVPDPPVITIQPQPANQTVNMGATVGYSVTAIGAPLPAAGAPPLRYQWRKNGNIIGANSATLTLSNVGRAQNGTYFVIVTNTGGSVTSSIVNLKVLVPQLLGSPSLSPDGTLLLNSTDANGGLLTTNDLANFEAQGSTNLVDWVTLPNALNLTNGMIQLQDNSGTNWPSRFYRIIEH